LLLASVKGIFEGKQMFQEFEGEKNGKRTAFSNLKTRVVLAD
jgi:hypothetical protein